MKYKSKVYAKAIAESATRKNVSLSEKEIENLRKFIIKNNDQKKIREIMSLAEKYILHKQGKSKIVVETPRKINNLHKKSVERTFGEGNILEEKINPELIAGIKIIVNGERQLDASLQKKLKKLF